MAQLAEAPTLSEDVILALREALLAWYDHGHRELPWRSSADPYAIWVSEIMLQQTQVATVLDYYARWMQRFPTLHDLADAPLDDALALWAGLGYYRRVRMLHQGALYVRDELDGKLPTSAATLKALPGVGAYTAGAIASIAFGEVTPIVDGNVERILARIAAVPGDPKARENQKTFWRLAGQLVDPERPGDLNQAMMELGATVCTPANPSCLLCPVRACCQALALGTPTDYPGKVQRAAARPQDVATSVVTARDGDRLYALLVRRPDTGLLAGLLEFPTVELVAGHDAQARRAALDQLLARLLGEDAQGVRSQLGTAKHLFSHLRMTFYVESNALGELGRLPALPADASWVEVSQLAQSALSGAQRKVERLAREVLR